MNPVLSTLKQHRTKVLLLLLIVGVVVFVWSTQRSKVNIVNVVEQLPQHSTMQYRTRNLEQIDGIVVHHSASFGQSAVDYARYHVKSRSWPGIGYHYVIYPDGRIELVNYHHTISYHTAGINTSKIGVCLSGNFEEGQPTKAQLESLKKLVAHLRRQFKQHLSVSGHRDHGTTSCPGAHLYPHLQHLHQA
jgi:N-acetyl-anhydromuramyl-L-alanine amidase AmpD